MKILTYTIGSRAIVVITLILTILTIQSVEAQNVLGPINVEQGAEEIYSLSSSAGNVTWRAPASVTLRDPSDAGVTAIFNSPGTFFISASFGSGGGSTLDVTVTGIPKPNDPVIESIECGSARLKASGGIPTNVTWYWQGKDSNGESTSRPIDRTKSFTHPDNLYTTNQGTGYYYIRARDNSNLKWSYAKGRVYVTIPNTPATPSNPIQEPICGTNSIKLILNAPNGITYQWYNPQGQNVANGNTYTINNVTTTLNYTVKAQVDNTDCIGPSRAIAVSPSDLKLTPVNGTNQCGSSDVIVQARSANVAPGAAGFSHRLYQSLDLSDTAYVTGTPSTSGGAAFTTSFIVSAQTRSYWLSAVKTVNGVTCEGTRYRVEATFKSNIQPSLTIANNNDGQCEPSATTLYALGGASGSSYEWYDEDNNLLGTNSNLVVNLDYNDTNSGSKTFYLGGTLYNEAGCSYPISPKKSKVVTVKRRPDVPTVTNNSACGIDQVTFNVTELFNHTYKWYTADDIFIEEGVSFTTLPLSTSTDYKVSASLNGCEGPRLIVTANIPLVPGVAGGENVSKCGSGVITLSATLGSNADEVHWYDAITEGNYLGSGLDFDTPLITESTYFFAESINTSSGCSASRNAILAIITTDITYYADFDNDNLGDLNNPIISCTHPANYVQNSNDQCPTIQSFLNDCSSGPTGDPTDWNYIYTRVYQTKQNTVTTPFFNPDNSLIQQITYFDGLGRPIQQIGIDQSPDATGIGNFGDIVTFIDYDDYGRMEKEYLPYATTTDQMGRYRTDVLAKTNAFYLGNNGKYQTTANPFSQKTFEPSPLNRIEKQAAPGNDWAKGSGHEIEFDYQANIASEVRLYTVDLSAGNENPVLAGAADFYAAGELYKTITKDENHTATDGKLHTIEEFTDKQGRVILKRTYALVSSLQEAHDTYYVYDDFGNLTYVIPPLVNTADGVSTTELSEFCYQYKYDYRNRLVEKKIPGKGEEYIVYNKLDQPIMTQDANQREKDNNLDVWLFTKFDAFGRVAYTGKATSPDGKSRTAIQNEVNDLTNELWVVQSETDKQGEYSESEVIYYNNGGYPTQNSNEGVLLTEILTINYYDTYIDKPTNAPENITILGSQPQVNQTPIVKGLSTVSRVKVLDQTPSKWVHTLTYYDDKARPVYSYSTNEYLETIDILETSIDFIGKPLKSKTTHIKGANTIVTIDNFQYDHTGRLLAQTQCVGDDTLGDSCGTGLGTDIPVDPIIEDVTSYSETKIASNSITVKNATLTTGAHLYIANGNGIEGEQELIVFNTYDNLGQLENKKVGGDASGQVQQSSGLQQVKYKYNVRGWLTDINDIANATPDKLFNFSIGYNQGASPLFNGNISQTQWRSDNADSSLKSYDYTYDPLNRITAATDNTGNYNLSNVTYDKNGNILTLDRTGHTNLGATTFGNMDDLSYAYDGNKLLKVTDGISGTAGQGGFSDGTNTNDDYEYDDNGSLKVDRNKGITDIEYNHMSLPTKVTINGSGGTGTIDYVYDATGMKQRKIVSTGTTTDYANGYLYENDDLKFFGHPEGYVEPDGLGGFDYVYQYKDHLGNIRLSYKNVGSSSSPDLEIQEENNYYPFGLKHKGYNIVQNGRDHEFEYNGMEIEESLGYNMMEMEMRQYDPAIARWVVHDPILHYDYSPYQAFDNNPIYWADPTGADSYKYNYETEQYEQYDDDGKLVNGNASFEDAIAWAESQNDGENDEPNPMTTRGSSSSSNDGRQLASAAGVATATETGVIDIFGGLFEGMSGTSVGVGALALTLSSDTDTYVDEYQKEEEKRTHVTYIKRGPNGAIYVGRASGFGTPQEVLKRRDAVHHMTALGFEEAELDQSGTGSMGSLAIRGREQQMIDFYGGAISDSDRRANAKSANAIRGVGKGNWNGPGYHAASNLKFGEVYKYTGYWKF